ncbi:Sds3-like-domain-containing protein [Exophiala viscosa]|uniref:Sds3-like-domain-containing protein n=1 Tax=Exophiala viscosa TaxID=2486360 RepID=A0AAN6E6S3_9EURO|nr:Sds3-like-domain-containing protein [Exophiala viscosa]KAI1627386.1 Sds3-like-domain-containing protein [Exophiala viscosa]
MDSAADSLLALSNTVAVIAAHDEPLSDDDRSSSLSELDDNLDDVEGEEEDVEPAKATDADSEAETERLQVTPEGLVKKKPFEISPSKLAQREGVDMRPEIESLTESLVSSPISSHGDSDLDDALSDAPDAEGEAEAEPKIGPRTSPTKRKREDDDSETEEAPRSQRRRTGSVTSEEEKSEPESEAEDSRRPTREHTIERGPALPGPDEEVDGPEDRQKEIEKIDTSEDSKGKSRSRPRRKAKGDDLQADDELEHEGAEDSEAVDENDTEATAKSEEETARRMAAMEALTSLERHFAALRDRLYDERIAAINHELALLSDSKPSKPSHPELLRQVEVVQKYRDEKFEVEQKLLVYKIGALKNKAVADRSQIHTQYFQTVRDIREKYLERISEHFYRIQRDRFKADSTIPSYTIPFPEKRSTQIVQQTAYNKEVSILSGLAKYVGFPAAPELAASKQKDVEDDIQRMGIPPTQTRPIRHTQRPAQSTGAQLSAPQAEEQFLEQTPWANPQHPIHRLSRQNSNRSPLNEFLTPASQQRTAEALQPAGSASTIADPNAHASSVINTPHDGQSSTTKMENLAGTNYQINSVSPLDTRRVVADGSDAPGKDVSRDFASSPLNARVHLAGSPPRAGSARPDKMTRLGNDSPFKHANNAGITAGSGFSGTGRFSIR